MNKKMIFALFAILSLSLSTPLFPCTVFHVKNTEGQVLVGRNFDFDKEGGRVFFVQGSSKKNGFVIFEQLGNDMPYDGMNDKGLFAAITAVTDTNLPFSLAKPMRKSLELIKIILEKAKTTHDALEIFPEYSIIFGRFFGYPLVHYIIVDKEGNSAIIEYTNDKMIILKQQNIMTNHYLTNEEDKINQSSLDRFNIVRQSLVKDNYSVEDMTKILRESSQENTIYSNIYDLKNFVVYSTYKNKATVTYDLRDELFLGSHGYNLDRGLQPITYSQNKSYMSARPHAGLGYDWDNVVYHYGGRILLPADDIRKYGIDITGFNNNSDNFFSLGIILEQRLFEWFNMSIGTIGYFDYKDDNAVGIVTNLGWEPDNHIPFQPFVTYRSETIFHDSIDTISSLSIGFNIEF